MRCRNAAAFGGKRGDDSLAPVRSMLHLINKELKAKLAQVYPPRRVNGGAAR
jgi:hypothetical protein